MKRLVDRKQDGSIVPVVDGEYTKLSEIYAFVADVQDILGDEYELDELSKIVRCKDCVHMVGRAEFPRECYCRMLGEAVPFDGFCHRGEAAHD